MHTSGRASASIAGEGGDSSQSGNECSVQGHEGRGRGIVSGSCFEKITWKMVTITIQAVRERKIIMKIEIPFNLNKHYEPSNRSGIVEAGNDTTL